MSKNYSLATETAAIRAKLDDLIKEAASGPIMARRRKSLDTELRDLIGQLQEVLLRIDPVKPPTSVFDPGNPNVVARFTSLALVAQTRHPLAALGRFYGSGVYALYYNGDFPIYLPLVRTETPIYVGKASPRIGGARTAREQGESLAGRLNEHRKNILRTLSTLRIEDFEARLLVVQSGLEGSAENYLINLFRPIWNSEVDILFGLGKHGDKASTRANRRSPWDTLHPGRTWASATREDARSIEKIESDVARHFVAHPVVRDSQELFEIFLRELRQG